MPQTGRCSQSVVPDTVKRAVLVVGHSSCLEDFARDCTEAVAAAAQMEYVI